MKKSMAEPRLPVLQKIIEGLSRLSLLAGAMMFLAGDKFLYEIKHIGFLASEGGGIIGGTLLMLLGAGIALLLKSPKPEQH